MEQQSVHANVVRGRIIGLSSRENHDRPLVPYLAVIIRLQWELMYTIRMLVVRKLFRHVTVVIRERMRFR